MVWWRVFCHPTYGLQHKSTIDVNRSTINAHQFNNQLDHRSITKRTNVCAEIWTGILHDWERALYQLSYQPLTILLWLLLNFYLYFNFYIEIFLSLTNPNLPIRIQNSKVSLLENETSRYLKKEQVWIKKFTNLKSKASCLWIRHDTTVIDHNPDNKRTFTYL
jgi:hypothetical protein